MADTSDVTDVTEAPEDPSTPPSLSPITTPPAPRILSFGESAQIESIDDRGQRLSWEMTAYRGIDRSLTDVGLAPADAPGVDHLVCFAFDLTYLGPQPNSSDRASVKPERTTGVPAPLVLPITIDGSETTVVTGGADSGCGIPEATRLPTQRRSLTIGERYARGILSVANNSGAAAPIGVRVDTPSPVIWR